MLQALAVLRRVRPRAVLGAGGYVSGPGGIAAWLLAHSAADPRAERRRRPDQPLPGALRAAQVLEAFPGSFGAGVQRAHDRQSGARRHRGAAGAGSSASPGADARARLLVFGGSQGAQRLNRRGAAGAVAARSRRAARRCAIRPARAASTRRAPPIARCGVEAEVLPFIDDMAAAYAWADLALCRAGAMTIAELAGGRPGRAAGAVARRHRRSPDQECRSAWRGSAPRRMLQERDLTPAALAAAASPSSRADRARLLAMARGRARARAVSMPRRGSRICAWLRRAA